MSLSNASSDVAPSLAELTALTGAVTAIATADRPAQDAPSQSDTNAAVATTTERTVFPVTILGPTNSSSQAPTVRHEENGVATPYVTLRSSDANNNNSRQQTRPNSKAERDEDDGSTNSRRRIDSSQQHFLLPHPVRGMNRTNVSDHMTYQKTYLTYSITPYGISEDIFIIFNHTI